MELVSVINAKYKQDFKIFLKFNDGLTGTVNLIPYLDGEVFEPLKNKDYFKTFSVDSFVNNRINPHCSLKVIKA